MINIFKKCPSCNSSLPLAVRDKLQCPNCKKWLKEDSKKADVGTFLTLAIVFSAYFIDWRLSIVLGVLMVIIGYLKLEYHVFED